MAAPSSSRLPIPSTNRCKFDVFLSFRGSDTRKNFTDHLYTALHQKGILAFKDDEELQRGNAISPELFKAIEESRIAVVIFSRNYASSTWCLDELAKIVDCANSSGLVVLPIFYDLRPTEVRQQTGNFEAAFAGHELSKDNREKVKTWRQALTQVANLSGWDLKDRHETKVIEEIVENVSSHLNLTFPTCHSKNIVGMHRVREIESDLGVGKLDELRVIGICGMPGIGKTTIAQVVFENIHKKFEASSFIANVGEDYEKKGLFHLQKQLFDDLLKTKVTIVNNVRQRLRNKRVLIILDDVKELEHIVDLVGEGSSEEFGAGSRIIITTRDEKLLENYGSKIHKVEKLTESESLLLFCQKAFKKDHPVDDFLELSYGFTDYANGLPLALVVLGSHLYRRNANDWSVEKKRWSDELKKLRDSNFFGPEKIFNILKLGFFGLDRAAKQIFLDIACFFKGENETDVRRIFESCGYHPECCIPSLLEKSLITIAGGKLWMHELLQQTGQQIVREESKWLGERSRLWNHTDIVPVLQNNKGTELVKGVFLSSPQQARVHLKADPFSEMRYLRLLKIKNVILSGCLEFTLSDLLSFLKWHGYPLKFLPSSFRPDKLVELHLPQSQIEQLWEENIKQPLEMLVIVDLSDCEFLTKTLDFSQVPKLERLILKGCKRLSDIHPSIGDLKGLISLNLQGCESLTTLPPIIKLGSLMTFILSGCSKLKRFPEIGENMKNLLKLHLDGTAIVELPTSIKHLTSLSLLNLKDCKLLQSLPDVICTSTSLQTLILQGCSNLRQLPENLGSLECLKVLDISRSAIRQLPSSIQFLKNLTGLSCAGCRDLPAERSSWCLPTFISCFLPPDLASNNSTSLQLPASFSGLCSLRKLILSDCNLFEGAIPEDIGCISSLKYLDLSGNNFETLPQSISRLYQLEDLRLNDCSNLKSLPSSLPISIRGIFSDNCPLLDETFQEIVWTSTALGFSFINCKYDKFYPIPTADQHLNRQNIQRLFMELFSQGGCFQCFLGAETDIASWFCRQSTNSSIKIPLPQDLDGKSQWIGFALWFLVESEVHDSVDSEEDPQSKYFNMRNYSCDIFTNDEDPPLKYPLADRDGRKTYQHLLYIPADDFAKRLNKRFIEAKINIKLTGVEVVACRARLLYSEDVPEFVGTLVHLWNHEQVGHMANPSSSRCTDQSNEQIYPFASETSFLIEIERQIFRDLSSTRMEGHEVRTRVEALLLEEIFELDSARSYDYGFIFSLRAILPWFTHQSIGSVVLSLKDQSIGGVVRMHLPPLLHCDNKWVGFSLFVAFTLPPPGVLSEKYSSLNCHLSTFRGIMGPQHYLTLEFPGEDNFMGLDRVLVIHIPRKHFPEDLGDCIQASFKSLTPGVEIQMSGMRLVCQQDLNGLIQTISHCTLRSPFAYFGQDDKTFMLEENKIGVHLTMETSLLQRAKARMLQDWQNSSTGSKVITDQEIELMILSETPFNPPEKKDSVIKWKRNLELLFLFFFRLPVELSVTVFLRENTVSCSKDHGPNSGIFYQKEIPEWFTEQQPSETLVSPLPINLGKDENFLGFVVCAVFSVEPSPADVLNYLYSGHHPRLACNFHLSPEIPCRLEVGSLAGTSPKNKFMWLYLRRFVWQQYIPGNYFKDHLNELPKLGVSFTSDSPVLAVKQCGFRILYNREVRKLWKATAQCYTSFVDNNEDHIRQFIEDERRSFTTTSSFGASQQEDFDRYFKNQLLDQHQLRSKMLKQIVTNFLDGFQQQDFDPPAKQNQLQDFDHCSIYNSCFPPNEIVEWFELQSNGPSITILLPPDLYRDANWIGLAFCASFAALKNSSANFANNVDPGLPHHLTCHMEKDDGDSLESLHDYCTINEEFQWMHLGGFMWLSYIPRTWFLDQLSECGCLAASIVSGHGAFSVDKCGFRLVYQHDEEELKQTLMLCKTTLLDLYEEKQDHEADGTSRTLAENHAGETSSANGIRDRDFDCALTYNSCFPPSDIVEWFGHHSNGPSVKIPLPSNLYNWVGLALCAYFSVLDPSNASLDHLDSEKLDHHLTCYLESDSGSTDFFHCYITKNKEFKWLHLGGFLWVSYIPQRLLSLGHQSNECINLEASIGSDHQGLGVLKCGLRLLYQHDVEEFKKTIMHCKTSLSEHYNGKNKPDVGGETKSSGNSSKCVIGGPHSGKLERPQIDKGKGVLVSGW